jgi:hypothetical protein
MEGRIEVTEGRGRRRNLLLDELQENTGYWKLKEKAVDCSLWKKSLWKRLWTCRETDNRIGE